MISYGYDKVSFIRPAYLGDIVTTTYEVICAETEIVILRTSITGINQKGLTFLDSSHILKRVFQNILPIYGES